MGQTKILEIQMAKHGLILYALLKIGNLCFKDSYLFMSESLDSLVTNLRAEGEEHFNILKKEFGEIPNKIYYHF